MESECNHEAIPKLRISISNVSSILLKCDINRLLKSVSTFSFSFPINKSIPGISSSRLHDYLSQTLQVQMITVQKHVFNIKYDTTSSSIPAIT